MPLNRYAIYVWHMLVSSSEIPNNIRVYFYAVHDLQEHNLDNLAQHTGLSSYVSDEQMGYFFPHPLSFLMVDLQFPNPSFQQTLHQFQQDICHHAARQHCRTVADLWEEEQLPKSQMRLTTGIPRLAKRKKEKPQKYFSAWISTVVAFTENAGFAKCYLSI